MSGPPPNPNARWRKGGKGGAVVALPADGYDGPLPDWPLNTDPSDAEMSLWKTLWRTPQAAAWAKSGYTRVVARYVLVTILAEDPSNPSAALLSEVRQLEDRLGLSPMSMKRLMWEIDDSPAGGGLAEVTDIGDRFANL